jgi:hypothetical protein
MRLIERGARRMRWLAKLVHDIRTAGAEAGVSKVRIVRDLVVLNLVHWLGVRAYFQYRLFDPRLTPAQKSQYVPDTKWATDRLWALLVPTQYELPYSNKLVFSRVFGGAGLPVAKLYGVYDPAVGHTFDGRGLRDSAELRSWMRGCGSEGFVFKPVWGGEGHNVLVFVARVPGDPEAFRTLAGDQYDAEQLVAFTQSTDLPKRLGAADPRSYLVEERVRPHPALATLVGPTLCCARVVTVIGLNGRPTILGAVYKMQPKPLGIDNMSSGAVASWVDPETGALAAGRSRRDNTYTSVIPGTDREFVGYRLPHWAEVKDVALRAAAVIPWARAIGWDIAISDRGPVLIEGNAKWSPALLQMCAPYGLMTGEFKALYDALRSVRKTSR